MVKKSRISFICMTMAILFVLFAVLTGFTNYLIHKNTIKNIEDNLDDIIYTYTLEQTSKLQPNQLVIEVDNFGEYIVKNGDNIYDSIFINDIYVMAKNNSAVPMGHIDTIYYKANNKLIVATDMKEILAIQNDALRTLLIGFLILYLVMFVVTIICSAMVINPIKESFYRQKKFISNASHELKTPLAIISSSADILQKTDDNKWLKNIKSQTNRLSTLVEDMLEIATMDEGSYLIKKHNFNLSDEILETILPYESVAFENGKSLFFNIQPSLEVYGNAESIKKITGILMDNAIKYSCKNGSIKVDLKKVDSKIVLTIFNDGSNVRNEQSNKIFERFYRADDSRSREDGGSGLGLAIAEGLCKANKWKISAHSEYNKSMTITIVF